MIRIGVMMLRTLMASAITAALLDARNSLQKSAMVGADDQHRQRDRALSDLVNGRKHDLHRPAPSDHVECRVIERHASRW